MAQISFDTDINRHSPWRLFRYPDCVKRYDMLAWQSGAWKRIAGATDNCMRHRALTFSPLTTDRIRLLIHETNGARSTRVYEVRLYGAPLSV